MTTRLSVLGRGGQLKAMPPWRRAARIDEAIVALVTAAGRPAPPKLRALLDWLDRGEVA